MFKHTLTHIAKNQFVRQLIGAGIGALVALTVYTVYRSVSFTVNAYLLKPAAEETAADTNADKAEAFKRIGELAREKMDGVH